MPQGRSLPVGRVVQQAVLRAGLRRTRLASSTRQVIRSDLGSPITRTSPKPRRGGAYRPAILALKSPSNAPFLANVRIVPVGIKRPLDVEIVQVYSLGFRPVETNQQQRINNNTEQASIAEQTNVGGTIPELAYQSGTRSQRRSAASYLARPWFGTGLHQTPASNRNEQQGRSSHKPRPNVIKAGLVPAE